MLSAATVLARVNKLEKESVIKFYPEKIKYNIIFSEAF